MKPVTAPANTEVKRNIMDLFNTFNKLSLLPRGFTARVTFIPHAVPILVIPAVTANRTNI